MKYYKALIVTVLLALLPCVTAYAGLQYPSLASSDSGKTGPSSEGTNEQAENLEKQKLMEDARKLAEDFKDFLSDLTQLSKDTVAPLADSVSEWITKNYAHLSKEGREKLIAFLEKLKKEYQNIEKMSLETLKDILQTVTDFFNQLKKEEPPEDAEPPKEVSGERAV